MAKVRAWATFFALMYLMFPRVVGAAELHILVGYGYFPPWQYDDIEDDFAGLDRDVLDLWVEELAASHDLDLTLEFVKCPLKRCLSYLENGRLDLKTGLLRRQDREKFLRYIEPSYYPYNREAVYARKSDNRIIATYNDLKEVTVGVTRAGKVFERFDRDQTIRKVFTSGTQNGLAMLKAGRFDVLIGSEIAVDYLIRENNLDAELVKMPYHQSKESSGYFAVGRMSPLVGHLDKLNAAMARIIEKGLVEQAAGKVLLKIAK